MDEVGMKVLRRLQSICARQECCSKDILAKALKALEGDEASAMEVVSMLVEEKYLDDQRYAVAYARDKASLAGWGPVKIRYMLSSKGISREDAEVAIGQIETDGAMRKLTAVLSQKARTLKGDSQARLKLLKFALGRGYEYDMVNSLVNQVLKQEE